MTTVLCGKRPEGVYQTGGLWGCEAVRLWGMEAVGRDSREDPWVGGFMGRGSMGSGGLYGVGRGP